MQDISLGTAVAVLLLGALLLGVAKLVQRRRKIPFPSAANTARKFNELRERVWEHHRHRLGDTFVYDGALATSDPEAAKLLLLSKQHGEKRPALYRIWANFLPYVDGILFMDGEPWRLHTRALVPLLQGPSSDAHARLFAASARAWIAGVASGHGPNGEGMPPRAATSAPGVVLRARAVVPDLLRGLRHASSLAFLHLALGLRWDDPQAAAFLAAAERYGVLCYHELSLLALPRIWPQLLLHGRRMRAATAHALSRGSPVVPDVGDTDARPPSRPTFLRALADAGEGEAALAGAMNHLWTAHKAAAFAAHAVLFELARCPEWQTRLRNELRAEVGGAEAVPKRVDLPRLPVWGAVWKEALRLHVVSFGTLRTTAPTPPVRIGGAAVPPGTDVLLLLHGMHVRDDVWPLPLAFLPQRWHDGLATAHPLAAVDAVRNAAGTPPGEPTPADHGLRQGDQVPPAARDYYYPFLAGARRCAGLYLAEAEAIALVHAVLAVATVRVPKADGGASMRMAPLMFVAPDGPTECVLEPLTE